MKNIIYKFLIMSFVFSLALFFLYFNNLQLVNPKTRVYYNSLKVLLRKQGYSTSLIVISTKRIKWHNDIQVMFSGAAKKSRHLRGDAIDIIVFDINRDGRSDSKDVDIVFSILDKKIIKSHGGIGTYKGEKTFINRQMIHIDCRGYKARWYK